MTQEQLLRKEWKLLKTLEHKKKITPRLFYEPLPVQEAFRNDNALVKGSYGGNRSGKTECGAEYLVSKCEDNPKMRAWACAETFNDSVNIQQRKIWSYCSKNRIKYGTYTEVNGFTNRKLIFDNGSIIIFKSYDQEREAFQSDDIDIVWFDEEPPYDIYKETRMRLLDRNGEMIFTMTSLKGMTDLLLDMFDGYQVIKSQYAPLLDREIPRIVDKNGIRIYMLWTTENPYIDQARVQQEAKLMTRQEIESRIYGLPVNLSGRIYLNFNTDIHVKPIDDILEMDLEIYNVLDPHDRKPWAIGWFGIDKTGTLYMIDEYPEKDFNDMMFDDKTYEEYGELIRQHERMIFDILGKKVKRRIIDPNFGNKTVQLALRQGGQSKTTPRKELLKLGLNYKDAIDTLEAGHLKVRSLLYWQEKLGEIITQPKLFYGDNCKNSIKQMLRYAREDPTTKDGDVKDKARVKEKYKDFPDLSRYLAMSDPKWWGPEVYEPPEETERMY